MQSNPTQLILELLKQIFSGGQQQQQSQAQPQQPQPQPSPEMATIPAAPGSLPGLMPPGQRPDVAQPEPGAGNRALVQGAMNQGLLHGQQGQHVRLGMDGLPIDSNAPSGIPWLEAHAPAGHSWDQTYNNPHQTTQYPTTDQPLHHIFNTPEGRFVTDATGTVMGHSNKGWPDLSLPSLFDPKNAPTNPQEAKFGPFLPPEQAKLRQNLQAGFNKGLGAGTSSSATTGGNWFQQAFQ